MRKLSLQLDTNNITLKEGYEKFINFKKARNLSEETISYYDTCYNYFSGFYNASELCSKITEGTWYEYINYLKENRPNIRDTTINTYLRGLRAILYYFMKLGYTPKFSVQLIKTDKRIKETYSDEELILLLKKPNIKKCSFVEYRNWVVVNYLLATGNRISTVINIKIGDIDFSSDMITLSKTKNRNQQIIPLSRTMSEILKEYLLYRQGEADDYLFCSTYGNKLDRQGLSTAIERYNKSRGVVKTSVHLFRHTFAKKWILNGGDIFRLQKILGHSSLEMVKEYVNIFGTDLKSQFDKYNPLENIYEANNMKGKKSIKMQD